MSFEDHDKEFALDDDVESAFDRMLFGSIHEKPHEMELPDSWRHITLAMPENFFNIFKATLEGYKLHANTEKTFPAFEALVLEAFNSLPEVIIQQIEGK